MSRRRQILIWWRCNTNMCFITNLVKVFLYCHLAGINHKLTFFVRRRKSCYLRMKAVSAGVWSYAVTRPILKMSVGNEYISVTQPSPDRVSSSQGSNNEPVNRAVGFCAVSGPSWAQLEFKTHFESSRRFITIQSYLHMQNRNGWKITGNYYCCYSNILHASKKQ